MTRRRNRTYTSTTGVRNIRRLTSVELNDLIDEELGRSISDTVYSLRGFSNLAVKEVRFNDLTNNGAKILKDELISIIKTSHPNIIKYHQVIEDDDYIYIVMDRYSGTLDRLLVKHMRTHEPIPKELFTSVLRQVTEALAYLHNVSGVDARGNSYRGIVHHNLKPTNILISKSGKHIVLSDFGYCKNAIRDGNTQVDMPAYMAPETLIRNETSTASDIWALGVIIYELAALKKPRFTTSGKPNDIFVNGWKPDLDAITDSFIRDILERIFVLNPDERPTAQELSKLFRASNASDIEVDVQNKILLDKCKYLEAALSDANAKVEALTDNLKNKSSRMANLEKNLHTKANTITTLKKELTSKSNKIDALKMQCNNLKQQVSSNDKRRDKNRPSNKPLATVSTNDASITRNPKVGQESKDQPRRERYPCLLTIAGIPDGITFEDIREHIDQFEHADVLKAIAESRKKRCNHNPSEVYLFCTEENGKILLDAFGTMILNGTGLSATLVDA